MSRARALEGTRYLTAVSASPGVPTLPELRGAMARPPALSARVPRGVSDGEDGTSPGDHAIALLLIEDNPLDAELVEEFLGASDTRFEVTRASRLRDGLREIEARPFEIVLLDLRLPDGSGLDALGDVVKHAGGAPVVVLTGMNDEFLASRCLEAGADDYVEKDKLEVSVLRRAIGHALARARARDLNRRLEHADRLATLGKLAAGVAHEINNPAAFLQINLDELAERATEVRSTLRRASGVQQRALRNLETMEGLIKESRLGLERIVSVVRELGPYSRTEADAVELVDLEQLSRGASTMVMHELKPRARLVLDFHPVSKVAAHPKKLGQVVINLLVNAAHSITEGHPEKNEVRIGTRTEGARVVLFVEDTGCGIPPRLRESIFQPFFTTKSRSVGTGLGLPIAADIVRSYGGEIRMTSTPGHGSRFEIVLPTQRPAETGASSVRRLKAVAATRRLRILIIDDERALASALKRSLTAHHDVEVENDGQAAIGRLDRDGAFDVILCDLMMPGLDGIDVLDHVRNRHPELSSHFAFMSGGAFTERADEAQRNPTVPLISKPVELPTLLETIERLGSRPERSGSD